MIEKIYENPEIYRILIPLPQNPLKSLNSYVIHSGGEWLMIDTGFNRPECKAAMEEGIRELGIDMKHLKLFLTHLHSDHTGLVNDFCDQGIVPIMGETDHGLANRSVGDEGWNELRVLYAAYGFPKHEMDKQDAGNQAKVFGIRAEFPADIVEDGDEIHVGDIGLRCLLVPGHTPGQMCLYMEKEKILFSSDHVLFDITPNISLWTDEIRSLEDYLDSLEKIRKLDIKTTFPAHREFAGNIYERIDELKSHHRDRLQELLDAVRQQEGLSAYQAAGKLTWSARGRAFEDFSPNQKWFAMGETLAHLQWLRDFGYVTLDEENQIYSVPGRTTVEIQK